MSDAHDPYAALRYRDYRLLLAGGVLASIGAEIQAVAVGWELYERTRSAAYLGLAGLVQFLPVLLLALPAGQAADHHSRKRLFQLAQCTAALSSLGLAALSFWHGPAEWVFPCLLLAGVARAFSGPARSSLLPQVVPPEVLGNAVTWNSSGWQIANVAGPALGGAAIAVASQISSIGQATAAYIPAALCSLACVVMLVPVRPRQAASRPPLARSMASLLAGVCFVWRSDLLLAAISLDLFAVLLGGATALLPIYAEDILHVGPVGLGWLRAAPALGAVLTALALAHRPPLKRPGRALLLAVAGFGAATIVFGFSQNYLLSFAMLALTGAFDNVSVVVRGTLVQTLTPDEMRGRVSAVNSLFISSSNELGAFESGATAALFGPVASVVGGGVGTILVVLLAAARWPRLVRLGPLHTLLPVDAAAVENAARLAAESWKTGRPMRGIHDLTTEEAYQLVAGRFGHELPPLDAVENEDWGRDYVLQHFQRHTPEELAAAGLTWDEGQ
jgi:MFS family permease